MATDKRPARRRVGQVSIYEHHGSWYTYYRDNGRPVRQRAGETEAQAEYAASLLNAKLLAGRGGLGRSGPLRQHTAPRSAVPAQMPPHPLPSRIQPASRYLTI
jgi:hypothetical protein